MWIQLWFWQKCSVTFSSSDSNFPSPHNLMFNLYWLSGKIKFVTVNPTYWFLHLYRSADISHWYCCNQAWNLCDLFPDTALWNSLLRYKTYYISQLMLSHLYIAFSSTLEPSIFSFDLTKWSFSVFTLQIANRMGHGNSALYLGERIVALCAFCNILWTLFNARWNVKTRLKYIILMLFLTFT